MNLVRGTAQGPADAGIGSAARHSPESKDHTLMESLPEKQTRRNTDDHAEALPMIGGRKRQASGFQMGRVDEAPRLDRTIRETSASLNDDCKANEHTASVPRTKRRTTTDRRNQSTHRPGLRPDTLSSPGSNIAGRAAAARRQEQILETESVEVRSSSASSERAVLQPLVDVAPAKPPSNRTERLLLLQQICQSDNEYTRFAEYLLRHYDITENVRRDAQAADFVRLRNLKDDFHRFCASLGPETSGHRDQLKIYRIKLFFSKVLNLEVTGEWDRHAHGGVRGPYVYGLVARTNLTS
jgi:hypothetical protein